MSKGAESADSEMMGTERAVLVGIGASAGGLEVLRDLIGTLSACDNLSYVIAQHVSPTHVSMLMKLLAPQTQLEVTDLKDKQIPEAGVIYITPPNRDVVLKNGELRLKQPKQKIGPKPCINTFFTSLAEERGEKAIGVILSGTGSDGASGIKAIKTQGGVTIAQEPELAKYDGMPKAAIHTGCVDFVLPANKIGEAILRVTSKPNDIDWVLEDDLGRDEYSQVSNIVRINTAFKLSDYKSGTVQRRIARRMAVVGVETLEQYINYLKNNKEESVSLMRDTFIGVTEFFRDQEPYQALREIIGTLVEQRNLRDVIRCWVPGCATGEEVYSIAMLFEEEIERQEKFGLQYMIFASDMDDNSIESARSALYANSELDNVLPVLRERYMESIGEHSRITKSIRNRVVFARQNVIEDPPFARMDLISCRNLLIYFNTPVQKRVLEIFHYSLNPKGYLFLGKSENVDQHNPLFKTIDSRARLYQRLEGASHYTLPMTQGVPRSQISSKELQSNAATSTDVVSMITLENLVEQYAPPSLVVNADDCIVHFQGDLKPFLDFPSGRADMYLFELVNTELRSELRALVYRCRRDQKRAEGSSWPMDINGQARVVTPAVAALESGNNALLLISFLVSSVDNVQVLAASNKEEWDSLIIKELERELANTRTHLNIVVEELETSNEELQSLNEELQSANEELQSTNEELQTSNEELQSTNEELLTVNEELQIKSSELEGSYNDLNNVKQSLEFPLMVVDSGLRITQFNLACSDVLALDNPNERTSLNSVQWMVDIPNLNANVRTVINTGDRRSELVTKSDDTFYMLNIMPYLVGGQRCEGAVLVFENITSRYKAELALKQSNERFDFAVKGSSDGLWDWNIATGELYWSPRFKEILGDVDVLPNVDYLTSLIAPEHKEHVIEERQFSLAERKSYQLEYRLNTNSDDCCWVLERGDIVESSEDGQAIRMAGSLTNITEAKKARLALEASEKRFHQAMHYAAIGMALVGTDGKWLVVNPALCDIVGYTANELLARDFQSITHPDDLNLDLNYVKKILGGEVDTYQMDKRYIHKKGHVVWIQLNVSLVKDDQEKPKYFISQIQDISDRKENEYELRLAANVFSNTLDGIMIVSPDGLIEKVNKGFEKILGYSNDEIAGKHARILHSNRHDYTFYKIMWDHIIKDGVWQGEIWGRHKDGRIVPVWLGTSSLYDDSGNVEHYIAMMYDITEQKLSQERINYLAHYDELTGLPNRSLFVERLTHSLAHAKRQHSSLAILFIDLDDFKKINDSRGHPAGDELLLLVAERIKKITREADTVARLGGDEFTMLIEDSLDLSAIRITARKVLDALSEPFELQSGEGFISASIGIACYPEDGDNAESLLKHADLAMYKSKEFGRNHYHFYTQEMSKIADERMIIHTELRKALDEGALEVFYQPIVNVNNRLCIGAEALLRWNHSTMGSMLPSKFVSVAEENNLIIGLGEYVFYQSCNQMKQWLDKGLNLDFISVNVSGRQISKGDFFNMAKRVLKQTGCPAEKITLELTESYIMSEKDHAISVLSDLRDMGFGLAIDDFGTGYSSLSYLSRLPVDKLKLDQSFVRDIPGDTNDTAIAKAIFRLGDTLGLQVVAEGVETEEQHQFISEQDCLYSQGFLYAKPQSMQEFEKQLAVLDS